MNEIFMSETLPPDWPFSLSLSHQTVYFNITFIIYGAALQYIEVLLKSRINYNKHVHRFPKVFPSCIVEDTVETILYTMHKYYA